MAAGDECTCRPVAVARYEAADGVVADVAMVVEPGWRRVGLAEVAVALDRQLVERAVRALDPPAP